jgi:hypothetical protein
MKKKKITEKEMVILLEKNKKFTSIKKTKRNDDLFVNSVSFDGKVPFQGVKKV